MVDEVCPVEEIDVRTAKDILLGTPKLSSRDALHLSIMRRRDVAQILTFDQGFDGLPGITRIV